MIMERHMGENVMPKVQCGNIASGNHVMKYGVTRDRIRTK